MIDFRPFYQQIATTNLSAWLETLPLQLKEMGKTNPWRLYKMVKKSWTFSLIYRQTLSI